MNIQLEAYDEDKYQTVKYEIIAERLSKFYLVSCKIGNTESDSYEFMDKYELADLLETLQEKDFFYEVYGTFKPLNNVLNKRYMSNKIGQKNKAKKEINMYFTETEKLFLRVAIKSEDWGAINDAEMDALMLEFFKEEDYGRMVAQQEQGTLYLDIKNFAKELVKKGEYLSQ